MIQQSGCVNRCSVRNRFSRGLPVGGYLARKWGQENGQCGCVERRAAGAFAGHLIFLLLGPKEKANQVSLAVLHYPL